LKCLAGRLCGDLMILFTKKQEELHEDHEAEEDLRFARRGHASCPTGLVAIA